LNTWFKKRPQSEYYLKNVFGTLPVPFRGKTNVFILKYVAYKILMRKRFTNSAKYSEGKTIFTPEEQQHCLFGHANS